MDEISTYYSSSLVNLGPFLEDDNGTKSWVLHVTGTVSPLSYHFSILLSSQISRNLIDIMSFSHKSGMALESKIWLFKDLSRLSLATGRFNCSTNAITGSTNSFSTNTKIMLIRTQMLIHKVLVVFVLSTTTPREVS